MRHHKMAELMENVEKAISRIMADKVYTSAEFKREKDNFHVIIFCIRWLQFYSDCLQSLCKNLERAETKKWLTETLETLMKVLAGRN